jgi:hypothetical protein
LNMKIKHFKMKNKDCIVSLRLDMVAASLSTFLRFWYKRQNITFSECISVALTICFGCYHHAIALSTFQSFNLHRLFPICQRANRVEEKGVEPSCLHYGIGKV